MKIWLKIALNAVRLPKFEPVNGKSWSPRKIMVNDLRNVPGWRDFAHAQRTAWSLAQGHTLFCQITPFIFIVAPKKLHSEEANRGKGFQICWKNLPLRIGHVIRRMRSGCSLQTQCRWYPVGYVRTYNSRTDSRRIVKLGGGVDHVTRHV